MCSVAWYVVLMLHGLLCTNSLSGAAAACYCGFTQVLPELQDPQVNDRPILKAGERE